jgi:2-methylisocitrate lyase-like PEP mutase family enzyme
MGTANDIRERLDRGETINMPGCYDALSARLATEAGFEVLFISGYSVAASRLGLPDYGYLTQTEIVEAARSVCDNTGAPVIVDADTGYGNSLNTLRTGRLLSRAGAAGVFLEDQTWPKKCGHFSGKSVVDRDEWLAKLQAIIDLRKEGIDLFLVARTDARSAVSLDEAIARAIAARDLGVDAIFVEAPESVAELERVAREVEGAVRVANMIEGGRTPLLSPQELHQLGYDLIVTPLSALLAAARAFREVYSLLRERGTLGEYMEKLVAFSDFSPIVALEEHRRLEERYRAEGVPSGLGSLPKG